MSTLRENIVRTALEWERTPYHPHACIKGVGADCGMYPLQVYKELGIIDTDLKVPYYPPQWHLHRNEELYLETILRAGGVEIPGPPLPGDFAVFRIGKVFSHGAIVIAWPEVIHSALRVGVVRCNVQLQSTLSRCKVKFFTSEVLNVR